SMAETANLTDSRCCFFLYDSSKVQEEGDLTRDGIYYYSPEDTPIDQQELLCGQLAGVCRCVSELSSSPVRLLCLRKSKYAVRMTDNFLWALSCAGDIPDVSVCDLLDQLIALFCFYSGPVRKSYQLYSKEELALRWARYLCYLQGGSTELHNIFSCLRTIDSTHIDPLLLLKAALILQACQRCPLVLAGCILYRGRVVSTQMPPALTVKVMVYETSSVGSPSSSTSTIQVFLMPTELHMLRCPPVDRACRSHFIQPPCQPSKSHLLSRTLSDTPTTDTDSSMPSSPRSSLSDELCFSLSPSRVNTPIHSNLMNQSEYFTPDSHDHNTSNGTILCAVEESLAGLNIKQDVDAKTKTDISLVPSILYQHRVKGLVLALLVEPEFNTDPSAREEVHHSSLASLNGLEAHLRNTSPGTPGPPGPYTFAHYDCIQNTLTTNVCGRSVGLQDQAFVKATKLVHSHFSHLDTLQEAIVRNASSAVYGTRSMAQETYFLQQGTPVKNSGSPDPQDSAFSLPRKARLWLLKHGVNLL
uniref:Hermansky-Pudlak syndrome 4 protein-like n=1 Tax=Sinocyclocheilus grahami TaxID=75366 RepID=A0A672TFG8_SINGR